MNMKLHLHISDALGAALLEEELKNMPSGFAQRVRDNPLRASEMIKLAIERRITEAETDLGVPKAVEAQGQLPEGDEA